MKQRKCTAKIHDTMYAYNRYGCRCELAVKRRNDYRAVWRKTPAGIASIERSNAGRRQAQRTPTGQTIAEAARVQRQAVAGNYLRGGATVREAARRVGVSERTVLRWQRAGRLAA